MEGLLAAAKRYNPGNGADPASGMGPCVDRKQFETVRSFIESGKREGARLVLGGGAPDPRGYFIEPTIFDGVEPRMRIFQEEIFGPVLSVVSFGSFEEAMRLANDSRYGFAGSIFTREVGAVMRFIEGAEIQMVHVNEPTVGGEAQLPFGGGKATGYGDREMAEDGLNFFTQTKTVFINYSGSGSRSMVR